MKYKLLSGLLMIILLSCMLSGCKKTVSYTVTFDSMGGSTIEPQIVKEGKQITKPTDPSKEGF